MRTQNVRSPHKSALSQLSQCCLKAISKQAQKFVSPIRVQSQSYLKAISKLSQSHLKAHTKSCALRVLYKENKENRAPRLARSSLKASSVRPHRGLTTVSQIRFPHKGTASKWSQSCLKVISKLPSSFVKVEKTVAFMTFEL